MKSLFRVTAVDNIMMIIRNIVRYVNGSLFYVMVRYFYSNTINKHFHCVRAGCGYSFTRYTQMAQHLLQHQATAGLQISEKLGKFALKMQ